MICKILIVVKMKRSGIVSISLIINILLFVGLLGLYGLYFFGGAAAEDVPVERGHNMPAIERKIVEATHNIAYVDNDILLDGYKLAQELSAQFEAEQSRLENDLERRQRNFQIEIERFQRDIERGHVTMEEARLLEQELMIQQQDLMQLGETYRERLAVMEFQMNSELLDKIRDFLDRYNIEKGYDFILGYARGGGILYANKAHDITQEILDLINEEYDNNH